MVTKAEMEAKHKSKNPLERTVWHATGKEVLNEINATGFNRSFSGDKHGRLKDPFSILSYWLQQGHIC